jgi:hypothetical protein
MAVALDPFGQLLAVADTHSKLHIFNRQGDLVSQVPSARPFHFLAFVPAAPFLIGAADFGLVGCLDLQGRWAWRDGLVMHIGGLSVSGDGSVITLACFSEGAHCYDLTGHRRGKVPVADACRQASLSFDGNLLLTAGLGTELQLLDLNGRSLHRTVLDQPNGLIALSALGDRAFVALPDHRVLGLDMTPLSIG